MWTFLCKLATRFFAAPPAKAEPLYIEPNYEAGTNHLSDHQLGESIRGMGLFLGHSRRMYDQHVTTDRDDDILRRYYMASLTHYPSRAERLRAIWESGVLDDGENRLCRIRKKE